MVAGVRVGAATFELGASDATSVLEASVSFDASASLAVSASSEVSISWLVSESVALELVDSADRALRMLPELRLLAIRAMGDRTRRGIMMLSERDTSDEDDVDAADEEEEDADEELSVVEVVSVEVVLFDEPDDAVVNVDVVPEVSTALELTDAEAPSLWVTASASCAASEDSMLVSVRSATACSAVLIEATWVASSLSTSFAFSWVDTSDRA